MHWAALPPQEWLSFQHVFSYASAHNPHATIFNADIPALSCFPPLWLSPNAKLLAPKSMTALAAHPQHQAPALIRSEQKLPRELTGTQQTVAFCSTLTCRTCTNSWWDTAWSVPRHRCIQIHHSLAKHKCAFAHSCPQKRHSLHAGQAVWAHHADRPLTASNEDHVTQEEKEPL